MTRAALNACCVGCMLTTVAVVGGCAARDADQPAAHAATNDRPRVEHVVVCWLKDHGNEAHRQQLITASNNFVGKIPGLITVRAGDVLPSTRPSVDSGFDVAIVMTFVDEPSLAGYGRTPVHQQALRDVLRPLVDHYVVYDFVVAKK
jgi:hypothetical protein